MDITYYKKYEPIFGEWKIVREIGEGSFGKVFEIEREDFGHTYKAALKAITIPQSQSEIDSVMDDGMDRDSVTAYFRGFVQELVEELRIMSKLKGESNIVSYEDHRVIEHDESIGWDVLIRMELLTPLTKHSKENGLDRDDVIQLGIDICKALELCRNCNIIHRDIKPENVFVSENGRFKLGDFGIAKTVEKTTGGLSKKGTYTYMAPEVYKGEEYGPSVDIYSLGIVLYRYLNNNRTPFLPIDSVPTYKKKEEALYRRINGEALPAPVNADSELAAIILKACAYNPKDRYASPTEMREALEAVAAASADEVVPVVAEAASEEKTVAMKPAAPAALQKEAVAVGVSAAKKKLPAAEKAPAAVKSPAPAKKAAAEKQRSSFSVGQALCAFALVVCLLCGIFGAVSSVNKPETVVTKLGEAYFGELDVDTAWDAIAQIEDSIALLKENEQTYLDGVDTYLAGQDQLAAGRQQLAEGQAQIDANTQAYLEGKELIGTIESLMPAIQGMSSAAQTVRDINNGKISGDVNAALGEMRASVINFLANTEAVAALSDLVGMDVSSLLAASPTDPSVVGNVINMYYDALSQLKQYEDGLQQLADGKAQLAAGEAQLADGDAQLSQFEDGEAQIADGIMQLMINMAPAYRMNSNEQIVDSLAERLAEDLDTEIPELYNEEGLDEAAYEELCSAVLDELFRQDAEGNYICAERDGKTLALLDLDSCGLVVENATQYLDDLEAAMYDAEVNGTGIEYTTAEEQGVSTAALLICALLGLIAGVFGILGKSVPTVVAGFAAAIGTFAVKPFFTGNNYPQIPLSADITPDLMLVAIAVSAALSLCVGAVKLVNKHT